LDRLILKIRIIHIPFLIIYIGFVFIYTLFHWFFVIEKEWINLNEDIFKFWLPIGLPIIPIYLFLKPRIKVLNFKKDDGDGLFQMFAWLALVATTCISQEYIATATGKLTHIENITKIENQKITKYYTLDKYFFDKTNLSTYSTFDVSGKQNQELNFHLFVAVPIRKDSSESTISSCNAWLGIKYNQTVSNKLSNEEKEKAFQVFDSISRKQFEMSNINKFTYLEKIANSDNLTNYYEAVKLSSLHNSKQTLIFTANSLPFENRNQNTFKWIFYSFLIGNIAWLLLLLFHSINLTKVDHFDRGILRYERSWIYDLIGMFIPKPTEQFVVTPIIANLNVLIFIIMFCCGYGFMSFTSKDLLDLGACYRPLVANGQWWRLLTSTFLHGGLIHLTFNMFALIMVGIFLEPKLGYTKYAFLYLITGIIASLSSVFWHKPTVSVGASGAIFGLYGVFLALILTNRYGREHKKGLLIFALIYIGYNILAGFANVGTDNAAHIGGLVSGFLLGLLINSSVRKGDI
jgi:rhomboid protease GluP